MIWIIIIFFLAIIGAFGMLSFKAWEIRTSRASISNNETQIFNDISFRHIEKNVLYLTKHIIQSLILITVKYWFISVTKIKNWIFSKWPEIKNKIIKKRDNVSRPSRPSFFERAVMESRVKIKRIKEKVKRDHEEIIK